MLPSWMRPEGGKTADDHRDIPRGCSDPSAGAVFLTKLLRLDTRRALAAVRDDPAVSIEAGSFILPPLVGLAAGTVLFRRQRAGWRARDFSGSVNFALFAVRGNRMVLRTLSEKRLEALVTNEHGRAELLRNAKRDICTAKSVQLTHMDRDSSLVSNVLLNAVAEQFATGFVQRELGVPGVKCGRFGLGLAYGPEDANWRRGGTKMRAILASETTLKQIVTLAAVGDAAKIPSGTPGSFNMLLRLAEALNVKPEAAPETEPEPGKFGATRYRLKGEPVPGVAVGSPIATWMELCVPGGGPAGGHDRGGPDERHFSDKTTKALHGECY